MWSIGDIGKRPERSKNKEIKHERMTAVEWFRDQLEFDESVSIDNIEDLLEQAKEMEGAQRKNDFIGGYLTHAMKKNKLPYGVQYINKVADIEKQGEKLYNKNLKSK